MKSVLALALLAGVPAIAIVGCSTAPHTVEGQQDLDSSANYKLQEALRLDPSLRSVLDRSQGYAVFPTAGTGGLIIGGGYGKGVLFERGQATGYVDMTQLSAGAKIGGKEYSQIIVFNDQRPLLDFKNGTFTVSADASAVGLRSGVAGTAAFKDNVQIFVFDQGGLMADASIGGQTFRFTPIHEARQAAAMREGDQTVDLNRDYPADHKPADQKWQSQQNQQQQPQHQPNLNRDPD